MSATGLIQVTYRELAEHFGIGIEGARIKAKRRAAKGEWRLIPGNHPQDVVRVELLAEELCKGPHRPQRTPPHEHAEAAPTPPSLQLSQRIVTNDLEALVEVVSQLTAQTQSMSERLIEAERMKAEAQRDAGIAKAEMRAVGERLDLLQEQHLMELKALRDRMEAESKQLNHEIEAGTARERDVQGRLVAAEAELVATRARPWWRRLAG